MSKLNFYETGKLAPANIVREFGSIYIHQTTKGAITYRQGKFPNGNAWSLVDQAKPVPPGGGETLAETLALGNTTDGSDIKISTASGDSIVFVNAAQTRSISLVANPSVGNFTQTFQNKSGTIALTSDIPDTLYTGSGVLSGPTVVDGTISTHNLTFTNIGEWGVAAEEIVLGSNNYILLNGTIGIGVATPTSKVEIKGAGTTSGTSALLIQNSSNIETFRVLDDGTIKTNGGNGLNGFEIHQKTFTDPHVMSVYNSDYSKQIFLAYDTGVSGYVRLDKYTQDIYAGTHAFTGGTSIKATSAGDIFHVAPVVGNGGFYVSAAVDNNPYMYLQDAAGTTTNVIIKSSGDSYINNGGNFGIGTATPGSKLSIVGDGTTASTYAIRTLNSAAAETFSVLDNGVTTITKDTYNLILNPNGTSTLTEIQTTNIGYQVKSADGYFRLGRTGGAGPALIYTGDSADSLQLSGTTSGTPHIHINSAGQVGIGITSINSSALLELSSTTQGFLPPTMTGAQAEAIASPANGLIVYASSAGVGDITTAGWWGWRGANWYQLG